MTRPRDEFPSDLWEGFLYGLCWLAMILLEVSFYAVSQIGDLIRGSKR